mmetsp:Transcript_9690/g.24415  ORF Transcript_9690/g.24415 Transcript_9690/m.24415 type:complete len:327 (-) Transcript_9690:388-1368(-)
MPRRARPLTSRRLAAMKSPMPAPIVTPSEMATTGIRSASRPTAAMAAYSRCRMAARASHESSSVSARTSPPALKARASSERSSSARTDGSAAAPVAASRMSPSIVAPSALSWLPRESVISSRPLRCFTSITPARPSSAADELASAELSIGRLRQLASPTAMRVWIVLSSATPIASFCSGVYEFESTNTSAHERSAMGTGTSAEASDASVLRSASVSGEPSSKVSSLLTATRASAPTRQAPRSWVSSLSISEERTAAASRLARPEVSAPMPIRLSCRSLRWTAQVAVLITSVRNSARCVSCGASSSASESSSGMCARSATLIAGSVR